MKEFYVYGYIRLDNNSYFYIGKGKNDRMYKMQNRPNHFINIINNVSCAVEIIKDNLTEEEAYDLEAETIEDLVFNEGYSINIQAFEINKGHHLTNRCWGGVGGSSNIPKPQHVIDKVRETNKTLIGSKNHKSIKVICLNTLETFESARIASIEKNIGNIYNSLNGITNYSGVNNNGEKLVWRYYEDYLNMTDEEINQCLYLAQHSKEGDNNPFYGKHHNEESKQKIREFNIGKKQSKETRAKYNRNGEKNPMYGKRGELNPNYGKPKSDECKKKLSEANGTKIRCIELNIIFVSLSEAERVIKDRYNVKVNRKTIVSRIKKGSHCGEIEINGNIVELHWEYV